MHFEPKPGLRAFEKRRTKQKKDRMKKQKKDRKTETETETTKLTSRMSYSDEKRKMVITEKVG